MHGKILRLPHEIREQLNRRLDDGVKSAPIIKWLNSLPEVRDVLKELFDGEPISKQNLSQYRKRSFARWQMLQSAAEFALDSVASRSSAEEQPQAGPLLDHLVHYLLTRLAAFAQSSSVSHDPRTELREIREFLTDVVALRRGELVTRRLKIEQDRLTLTQSQTQQEMEKTFWQWTRRPDITAKLYPHRDPDKERRAVIRMLDRELLGIKAPVDPEPEPEPLAFI